MVVTDRRLLLGKTARQGRFTDQPVNLIAFYLIASHEARAIESIAPTWNGFAYLTTGIVQTDCVAPRL